MTEVVNMRASITFVILLISLSFWISVPVLGQTGGFYFPSKSVNTGSQLSSNEITDIVQDRKGFIWIATTDGLNRFDGSGFLTLAMNSSDSNSLSSNHIASIAPMGDNTLLILHSSGVLDKFNLKSGSIASRKLSVENEDVSKVIANGTQIIIQTSNGVYSLKGNELQPLLNSKKTGRIYQIKMDSEGMIWVCSSKGLWVLRGTSRFQVVPGSESMSFFDISRLSNGLAALTSKGLYKVNNQLHLKRLTQAADSQWATKIHGSGKHVLLLGQSKVKTFSIDNDSMVDCFDANGNLLIKGKARCSFKDQQGSLWVGSEENGITIIWPEAVFGNFSAIGFQTKQSQGVYSMDYTQDNTLWLGGRGHIKIVPQNGLSSTKRLQALANEKITALSVSTEMRLAGTEQGKLAILTDDLEIDDMASLPQPATIQALHLEGTSVYCATNKGLSIYSIETGAFKRLEDKLLSDNGVFDIYPFGGKLILSTEKGLLRFNPAAENIELIGLKQVTKTANTPQIHQVLAHNKKVWLATKDFGVLVLGENLDKPELLFSIDRESGLDQNYITGLRIDEKNRAWIGTRNSLTRFETGNKSLFIFRNTDGIGTGDMLIGSHAQTKLISFGGRMGAIIFNPNVPKPSSSPVKLALTKVIEGENQFESPDVPYKKELSVGYHDNFFTLHFKALDFKSPENVRYDYKIEGVHDKWISIGNTNFGSFPNPDPGSYEVKIRAFDSHGRPTSNELSLPLKIRPPFYASLWFKLLVGGLLAGLILGVYFYNITQERRRNRRLEYEVDKRTFILKQQNVELAEAKESALESSKAKSEFMATMSHEIRTPMNGLLGTLDLMKGTQLNRDQKDYLNTIAECGENMLAIINEILDYSKIESGRLEPEKHAFDLVHVVENVADLYASRASDKDVDFILDVDKRLPKKILSDQTRLTQVLNNLLSNAVKFTADGFVKLSIEQIASTEKTVGLKICIQDSGIGIKPEKFESIFDAFTQADSSTTREYGGTGLGLAICKTIVTALGGKIWVESKPGEGSAFFVQLQTEIEKAEPHVSTPALALEKEPSILIITREKEQFAVLKKLSLELRMTPTFKSISDVTESGAKTQYDHLIIDTSELSSNSPDAELVGLNRLTKNLVKLVNRGTQADGNEKLLHKPLKRSEFYQVFAGTESTTGAQVSTPEPQVSSEMESISILLAEDNRVNQMVTGKIFKSLGFSLDIASNGKEAIDMQNNKEYDLILMDLLMPEVDGKEATSSIRSKFPDENAPYIVAFSANIFNEEKEQFTQYGFSDILSKPAKVNDIKRLLERVASSRKEIA